MNIGVRYWGTKIDSLPEKLKNEVQIYLNRLTRTSIEGEGFLFHGNIHNAMSATAVIMKSFRRKRLTAFCVSVADLKEWIHERRETEDGLLYREFFEDVDLLVLWGIGAERRYKDDGDSVLKNLAFSRHFSMKPTIWITGNTLEDLGKTPFSYPAELLRIIGENCTSVLVD